MIARRTPEHDDMREPVDLYGHWLTALWADKAGFSQRNRAGESGVIESRPEHCRWAGRRQLTKALTN
jgi:hypothetical protein